ncbi:SGNH/GDSL hydrolase family protein [Parapedobacter sp.]
MIGRIKYLWVCFVCMGMVDCSFAEAADTLRYTDAQQLTLIGKPFPDGPFYHRLDTTAFPAMPLTVKRLLTHSAGLAISFSTNSTKIAAKWCTSARKPGNNMTAIAFEGLDLYIKRDGRWQYAGVARPATNECNEYTLVQDMEPGDKECLLYLPLYDETTSLEIGIEADADISARPNPFEKNIVIYGSSIVHGASASRPGLAYPARLSRETGYHFLNFGVSGNAKMELEVAKALAQMDMDAFILDCVPNSSPAQVTARTADLVKTIRASHPGVPIIAIQSVVREGGNFNRSIAERVAAQNANFKYEIDQLQKEVDDLYLITADGLLGDDHEATTDGTHPNDLGFDRMLQKIRPAVLKILKQYGI